MISEMSLQKRSLLFAKLSLIAYSDIGSEEETPEIRDSLKQLGFNDLVFYDKSEAQAYRFESTADIVITCRGTEPGQWNDIKADLMVYPVHSETVSRVHRGFKQEVDEFGQ